MSGDPPGIWWAIGALALLILGYLYVIIRSSRPRR
jgi:hypothetical protein